MRLPLAFISLFLPSQSLLTGFTSADFGLVVSFNRKTHSQPVGRRSEQTLLGAGEPHWVEGRMGPLHLQLAMRRV